MGALARISPGESARTHATRFASAGLRAPTASVRRPTSSLRVLTCGSVDDGKSTLIGRLLWDASAVHDDQRAFLHRSAKTAAGTPDFSLLVDGLSAEREQGITIDVAWRYLDTPTRRLVIIDSPGHEQYTRNMATGASHADAAILLVDARAGAKEQTRRHAAILDLMGVRRVILAVNKMDLVDWSEAQFRSIEADFLSLADRFAFQDAAAIPISAVLGDNIARRSAQTPWYAGPLLFDLLQSLPGRGAKANAPFRFPVQMVIRDGQDFRGLAGTVASGQVSIGDEVTDAVADGLARVKRILTMGRDLKTAAAGQAVVLQLDTDIDVSRGAVLATPGEQPATTRSFDARLVWLSDEPFSANRGYLLRTATDVVPVTSIAIKALLDLEAVTERPASGCAANDIVVARISLGRQAALDPFSDHHETGSFILVDPVSGASVAGGVVTSIHRSQEARRQANAFRLTREMLARGIGADLPANGASEAELRRRAHEVAILLRAAGVPVELEDRMETAIMGAAVPWLMTLLSCAFIIAVVLGIV